MNKFKFDIKTNDLSWEKTIHKNCDKKGCSARGEFKAPKSRIKLNEYYYFCLTHIKEYNKSWDFYKGLTVDQIEKSINKDSVWDRPSWPLKGNPSRVMEQINEFMNNDYNLFENDRNHQEYYKNRLFDETLTNEQNLALKSLGLKLPINLEEIKKKYKKLVKIFHPDVNDNNIEAEKRFKEINEAYRVLLKKFLKYTM